MKFIIAFLFACPALAQLSVSALYSTAKDLEYDGTITVSGTPLAAEQTDNSSGAFGLAVSYAMPVANRIGLELGTTYELEREFETFSSTIDGSPDSGDLDEPRPTISIATVFVNTTFAVTDRFYVLAGPLFPIINYETDDTIDVKGKISFQAGAGFKVMDKFSIEALYRVLNATVEGDTEVSGLPVTVDMEGSMNGVNVLAKWIF